MKYNQNQLETRIVFFGGKITKKVYRINFKVEQVLITFRKSQGVAPVELVVLCEIQIYQLMSWN